MSRGVMLEEGERLYAFGLWRDLMAEKEGAQDRLEGAPQRVQQAIRAASKRMSADGEEPDASDDANPFR